MQEALCLSVTRPVSQSVSQSACLPARNQSVRQPPAFLLRYSLYHMHKNTKDRAHLVDVGHIDGAKHHHENDESNQKAVKQTR